MPWLKAQIRIRVRRAYVAPLGYAVICNDLRACRLNDPTYWATILQRSVKPAATRRGDPSGDKDRVDNGAERREMRPHRPRKRAHQRISPKAPTVFGS